LPTGRASRSQPRSRLAIVQQTRPWITPAETVLKPSPCRWPHRRAHPRGRTRTGLCPRLDHSPPTLHNEDENPPQKTSASATPSSAKRHGDPEIFEVGNNQTTAPARRDFDCSKHVGEQMPRVRRPICEGQIEWHGRLPRKFRITRARIARGHCGRGRSACAARNIAGCRRKLCGASILRATQGRRPRNPSAAFVAEKLVERASFKEPLDLVRPFETRKLGKLTLGTDDEPRCVNGEKNATKILDALQRAKNRALSRWISRAGDWPMWAKPPQNSLPATHDSRSSALRCAKYSTRA